MPFDATNSTHRPRAAKLADSTNPGRPASAPSAATVLLTHEQEVALASESIAARLDAWTAILSHPLSTDHGRRTAARVALSVLGDFGRDLDLPDGVADRIRHRDPIGRRTGKRLAPALADADRKADDRALRAALDAVFPRPAPGVRLVPGAYEAACRAADRRLRDTLARLVNANHGLVWSEAHRVAAAVRGAAQRRGDDYRGNALAPADLFQEGCLGLMHAVRNFDPSRGHRLCTYACWWIRHAVSRAVADKSDLVRVPCHVQAKVSKMTTARARLRHASADACLEPTHEAIAREAGLSPAIAARAMDSAPRIISASRPVGHLGRDAADATTILDITPDPSAEDPADELDARTTRARLLAAVTALPAREVAIIRARYLDPVDAASTPTLKEVGATHDISRERVRQIETEVFATLRAAVVVRRRRPAFAGMEARP